MILQEDWGAQDGGSSSALSCHACSHQIVFMKNLNTKELAERGSDDMGDCQRSFEGEIWVREDKDQKK